MVDDILLSNSDFVVAIVCRVLRLATPKIFCMSSPLFNTKLIGLEALDIVQSVIVSGSQPYESY